MYVSTETFKLNCLTYSIYLGQQIVSCILSHTNLTDGIYILKTYALCNLCEQFRRTNMMIS